MQPGDKVCVYYYPLDGEELEGVATLRRHYKGHCWFVTFDDSVACVRTVFKRHLIPVKMQDDAATD